MAWFRKDNRVVSRTVDEGTIQVIDLQTKGTEPLMISNTGADLKVAYNRSGPYFLIPDGYQYTWEVKHPFNSEVYLFNDTTTSATTISFMIGGSMYDE